VEDAVKCRTLVAFLFGLVVPTIGAQNYTITDLGQLSPTAINIWGQVAGNLNGQAFVWTKFGGLKGLGTLTGGTSSSPAAINDLGTVVGVADGPATVVNPDGSTDTCPDVPQGFEWTSRNGMHGFGLIILGSTNPCFPSQAAIVGYANGINNSGKVVGTIDWSSFTFVVGFLWTRAGGIDPLPFPTNLDLVYPLTETNAINNYGQAVGAVGCCISLDMGHAFLWNSNGTADLGTLGGPDTNFEDYCSNARAVNDLDQIVGWSTTVASDTGQPCVSAGLNLPHAFVWSQGQSMQDLGALPGDTMSMACANNFFGQVIGTSGNSVVEQPYRGILGITVAGRPFIWTQNSGMQDLNTKIRASSGWVLDTATGINFWGQIVGSGTRNGQAHGFLLTPLLWSAVADPQLR
jgi:probable HAF family extracellular repeat protein